MDPLVLMLLVIGIFMILILLEAPIGLSVGLAGAIGITFLNGFDVADHVVGSVAYSSSASYALLVVPMYVLLGNLISNSGIGEGVYRSVHRIVGGLPGGLPVTAVLATAMFSGVSGSSAADVATFGKISVNEMSRYGYPRRYAAAVVAAAGTFAVLIPPSIVIVLYAIIASQPIGVMIVAAVVPGVISCLGLAAYIVVTEVLARRRRRTETGALGIGGQVRSPAPDKEPERSGPEVPSASNKRSDLMSVVWIAVLFGIVIGGLYGGQFTATEAGAIGAFLSVAVAMITRPVDGRGRWSVLTTSFRETASTTSMIFLLLAGSAIFSFFVASAGVPPQLTEWLTGLDVNPTFIVAGFLLLLIPLGMFLDGLSVMVLTVPLMTPVVTELGYNGVWFGILVLKAIEMGLITPPVGINVFIISGIAEVPATSVFRAVVPFFLLDVAITALFFIFPDLILWFPELMKVT